MSKSRYKYCVVPKCKSTTCRTPNKLFFTLPSDPIKREMWCKAMGRVGDKYKTLVSTRNVCEDHFNLPNDMENYIKYITTGVKQIKVKEGVIPHRFDCQQPVVSQPREKKKRIRYNKNIKNTSSRVDMSTQTEDTYILPELTGNYSVQLEYCSDSE